MADYIVKDTELTSVANAIRTAGGTNSLLSFPNGFVSAVGNISGGGGSSDFSTAQVTFINNTGFSSVAYVPNCVEENALGPGSPAMVAYIVPTPDATPVVRNVPLYKGTCHGFWDTNDEQFEISVSGDAVLIMGVAIF